MTPFKSIGLKLCTIALIVFLTGINYLGVKFGSAIAVVFSALKIGVIAAIVVLAFALGHGSFGNFTDSAPLRGGRVALGLPHVHHGHGRRVLGL